MKFFFPFLPKEFKKTKVIIHMKLLILPVAFAELLECGYFFMEKRVLSEAEKKYVEAAIIIFLVYLAMKYISPIVSPFIFALYWQVS